MKSPSVNSATFIDFFCLFFEEISMTQCTSLTLLCTLTSDDTQDEAALMTGAVLKTSMHLPVKKKKTWCKEMSADSAMTTNET